ncbi:MAG: hypothetical protein OXG15_09155 [Gammaproteobacteria bacterium]|nr:hypothetical protein [Gammaproteobacteria bacterium]
MTRTQTGVRSVRSALKQLYVVLFTVATVLPLNVDVIAQDAEVESKSTEDVYEGPLVNGLREGFGKLTYADGSVYEGEFANNLPSGNDEILSFADGRRYQGTFIEGQMQGYGTLEWPNGDVYVGTFNANAITGTGTFFWQNGNVSYTGTIEDGKRHGLGVMIWPDGRRYTGAFRQNERHGFGIYDNADGSSYRGFFESNQRHGDGVFEYADGIKEFQQWNAGELVVRKPLAEVSRCRLEIEGYRWMFESNQCINGLAHGTGTAVRLDGLAYINNGRFVVGHMVSGIISSLAGESSD